MKALIRSSVLIVVIMLISLGGCSSHQKAMKKKTGTATAKTENKTTTSTSRQAYNARMGNSLVKKQIKSDNLKSETISNNTIKPLTSIKDDTKSKEEAVAALKKQRELQKIYFDYDRSDIKPEAKEILVENAEILKEKNSTDILIEGHSDERGTEEYNLALGLKRAESVKRYLVSLGLSDTSMSTISYGEVNPEASGSDEGSWYLNRRAVVKEIKE